MLRINENTVKSHNNEVAGDREIGSYILYIQIFYTRVLKTVRYKRNWYGGKGKTTLWQGFPYIRFCYEILLYLSSVWFFFKGIFLNLFFSCYIGPLVRNSLVKSITTLVKFALFPGFILMGYNYTCPSSNDYHYKNEIQTCTLGITIFIHFSCLTKATS